jgi:hypothetical protein
MNLHVFNACIAIGWLMVTAGAFLLSPAAGAITGGLLLIGLSLLAVRLGGVYASNKVG